ncbi:MAG: Long-chain-fatty-acid--CoA ligase FadD13 [Syntrophorhabdus sp. PtaU1.Bin058]|nr:MAG: Long-chain-fatty-acid--CoA ligase FadD13 [Syntrophorhabdus sp. PtaU1.Bin058]
MMTVVDLVSRNARMYPESIAFVEVRPVNKVRKDITWAQFNERMNKVARILIARGAGKGTKVALLGRNSIDWLETFFGIMATGACVIPLNFRFTDEDIRYCCDIGEPGLFIFDEEFAGRIGQMKADLSTVGAFISIGTATQPGMENLESLMDGVSGAPVDVETCDEEDCALYFTSGTTGTPKAVLHAHRCLMVSAITEATCHDWKHGDSQLMMSPLYHLAIGHLLGGVIAGGTNVLLTELIKPDIIVDTLAREKATMVFLLVPWALDILDAFDKGEIRPERYDLCNLRLMHMGAQPVPVSLIKRWKSYFPDMSYDTSYGLSEAGGPGITHIGVQNEDKIGAIGRPSLIWDMRVVKDDGIDVGPDEVGEIIVKGSGIMKEYYRNPEATAQAVRNGWLYTGDLAKIDEDGFIYIVDRKKDLVISGGENIYPVEIETVIQKHPMVHDVAVIGVPNERLGEVVAAVITPVSGKTLTDAEMTAYCEENLPRYKRPRHFFFAPVPRSATGKIEKPKLRAAFAQGNL